jgi:thiamine-monophosphate kinase
MTRNHGPPGGVERGAEGERTPTLGPGVEFDRIRGFLEGRASADHVRVGPGDDAAVLAHGIVLSSDLSMEGVHFRLDWMDPVEAGFRATAAALSDLAAMAARPLGVLASVAVPAPGTLATSLMAGVREATQTAGTVLLGGDLTRSSGPAVVDVMVVGHTLSPLLRTGARPGDELWVTGTVGASTAAVEAWLAGRTPAPEARQAHVRPVPRLAEGVWLLEALGARAGLDLSDGIAGDAGHLAAASGVRVILEGQAVVSVAHREPGEEESRALARALHGGEDYELLVALPPGAGAARVEEFRQRFDLSLTRVGKVVAGEGVRLRPLGGGSPVPLSRGGWDHFRSDPGNPASP